MEYTEEQLDIINEYSDVPLAFSGYDKYEFWFSGHAEDGAQITVSYAGVHEIYRFEVGPDSKALLGTDPFNAWSSVRISRSAETLLELDNY